MANQTRSFGIDFIDPLFAVVFHISFTEAIMEQDWFDNPSLMIQQPYIFEIAVLALGYLTVILSWVFYHLSIREVEIKPGLRGIPRFFLDVLLLGAYFLLLVKFNNLKLEFALLVSVFVLFFLWDQAKLWEHPERDKPARRGVTVFWLGIFVLITAIYWPVGSDITRSIEWWDGLFLGAAYLATIMYRVHKDKPYPERLLNKLAIIKVPVPQESKGA